MAMLLMGLPLLGCSAQDEPKFVYPDKPVQYPMYDKSTLNNEADWHINNAHDPSIIKAEDGTYYAVSTDVRVGSPPKPGIMVRKSKDLIAWDWVGYAFNGIPAEAAAWTGAANLWAPDVHKFGEKYYLYYAASTFGTNQSYIGVATSASMEGPWEDQGEVVKSQKGDEANAIDPNIVIDADGKPWMAYGSFFGGIYVMAIDPATGKPAQPGDKGQRIARRDPATEEGAMEGPYIVYNEQFKQYYLFVSYDSLFSDYNVRVGRSDSITGPYTDMNGQRMDDIDFLPQYEIGNKIMGGYRFSEGEGWIAPGHNSVLNDDGDFYIVHHARPEGDKNWMYLHVRRIVWTKDGWPVVSPERYAGEQVQKVAKSDIAGDWERIVFDKDTDGQSEAEPLKLIADGHVGTKDSKDEWTFDGDHTVTLTWYEEDGSVASTEELLLLPSWDWERDMPVLTFTGLRSDGTGVWGKKQEGAGNSKK
ncbi:arabinan endo-1,5-alpha-L-arabinosidase [Paenibacillus kobensis]|uniref:arabinan endo-1,5-alpha-L-arabinosidase n=1 Tax=Paenibacillus kobensis TaxID=59841 RepID=UPI0038993A32